MRKKCGKMDAGTNEAYPSSGLTWGLVKSLQQRRNAGKENGTRHSDLLGPTGTALTNSNMRRGAILQAGQNVQSKHEENRAEHRVSGETAPRSRSTWSNRGRAQVRTGSAHSHGTRATDLSGRSSEDVKIKVEAFLPEKGVQANSKAWHNAMQSEHVQHMAIAYFLANVPEGFWAGRSLALEPLVKRAKRHADRLAVDRSPAHELLAFSEDLHLFAGLAGTEDFSELWEEKQFLVVSPLTTKTSEIPFSAQTSNSCKQRIGWSLSHRNL